MNQYPADYVVTNSDGSETSLDDLNQAMLDTGEAFRLRKYQADDVVLIRLGVGGVPSLQAVRNELAAAGVPPAQLESVDMIGHGLGEAGGGGEVFQYTIALGSGEQLVPQQLNAAKIANMEDGGHPIRTPADFAAVFDGLLVEAAKVGLHHCYTADTPAEGVLPIGKALANALGRTTIGYVDKAYFKEREGETYFLPGGEHREIQPGAPREAVQPEAPIGAPPVTRSEAIQRSVTGFWLPCGDRLRVMDLAGRVVRRLEGANCAGDASRVRWDGRDDAGRPLPRGVYFYSVGRGGGSARGRVILLP